MLRPEFKRPPHEPAMTPKYFFFNPTSIQTALTSMMNPLPGREAKFLEA
jgi:hypothetical protein